MATGEATRGVRFILKPEVAPDYLKAFAPVHREIDRLQQRMGGVFSGAGGNGAGGGNRFGGGNGMSHGMQEAVKAAQNGTAAIGKHLTNGALAHQKAVKAQLDGWAQLSAAGKKNLDNQTAWSRGLNNIAIQRAQADKKAADEEVKNAERVSKAREQQFKKEQKAEADYWKDFQQVGKQSKAQRERQEREEERDLQRRISAGNRQLQGLLRSGAQAQQHDQREEERDLAKRIQLGNRQLASLVRGGPQAQRQDQQRAERAERQAAREQEIALARQREGYHRLTESIGGSVDAITRLGEGAAYLGLIGKRDLGSLTDSLLKIRGIANVVTGGVRSAGDFGGLLRNLHAVHKTGGMGGVGRALMGLGPAAGGAANLGAVPGGITAAFSAPAGVIVGGIVAALTLAADQALIGGRFTKALGRSVGHGLVGTSQGLHSLVNMLETLGMEEHERKAIERRRLTQMEDPNNPRGAGLSAFGTGFGVFDAAAATARNAERLQIMSGQRQQQRATFRQIGNLGLAGDFQISAMQRERENAQAEIDRKLSATYLHANLTPYFLGTRDRYGRPGKSLVRSEGQTGIGELTGAFATGGIFSGATNIRDQGERMRFLQARRDASHEFLVGQNRIKQQLQSLAADRERVVTAAAQNRNADNPNQESERQTAEQLNRLNQERARLTRESDELHQRMRQRDIQDAAKLLEYSKQNADVAKDRLSQATRRLQSTEERIGAMNPLQVANIAQAKRRALASKDLSKTPLEDVYALQNGDEQSQDLARQALRARGRAMGENSGLEFKLEEHSVQSATRNAEIVSAQLGERSRAIQGVTNEVIVGGEYRVTVDIRDDMQLAEQLHEFEASIDQRFREHDQKVIAAIHAAVDAASKNIHQQGKNQSQ